MYALEKLDPRLPTKVFKDLGHRMRGDMHVIDLANKIFQLVSAMILEMADFKFMSAIEEFPVMSLNATGMPRGRAGQRFGARETGCERAVQWTRQ